MKEKEKNRKSIAVLAPVRPLCVPIYLNTDFAEQIGGHGKSSLFSLWERLELIYLDENNLPVKTGDTVIVNNFAQQIIFKLFSNEKTRGLVGANRAGFEPINNVVQAAERRESRAAAQIRKTIEKRRTDRAFFERALKDVFALLTGNENGGKSTDKSPETVDFAIKAALLAAANSGKISHRSINTLKQLSEYSAASEETRNIIAELSALTENGEEKGGSVVVPRELLSRVFEELNYNSEKSLITEFSALAENVEEKGGSVAVPQELLSRVFEELNYNSEKSLITELSALTENGEEKGGSVVVPRELLSRVFEELNHNSEKSLITELSALTENGEERGGSVVVPRELLSRVFGELNYKSKNAEKNGLITELSALAENGERKSGSVVVPRELLSRVFEELNYKNENALITELSALTENGEEKGGSVVVPQELLSRVFEELNHKSESAEKSGLISELSTLAKDGEERGGAVAVPRELLSRVFKELEYNSESGLITEFSALTENGERKSGYVAVPRELLSRVFEELNYKNENALITELSSLIDNGVEKGGSIAVPREVLSRVFGELEYNSEKSLVSELSALTENGEEKGGSVVVPRELLSRITEYLLRERTDYSNAVLEIAAKKAIAVEGSGFSASEAEKTASQIADEIFRFNSIENNAFRSKEPSSGALPRTSESISEAVIFLIERTESELAASGVPKIRLDLFSRWETRRLLEKTAKRFSSEILKKIGVDSKKVLREAVFVLALANRSDHGVSAGENAQYPGKAADMATALMGRLSKFISGGNTAGNEAAVYQTEIANKGGNSAYKHLLRFENFIDEIRSSNAVFRLKSADNSFGGHRNFDSVVFNENYGEDGDNFYRSENSLSASASVGGGLSGAEIAYNENGERAENTENRASAAVYKYVSENVADNGLKDNPAAYKAGNLSGGISSGLHVTDSESIEKNITVASSEIVYNSYDESGIGGVRADVSSVGGSLNGAEIAYNENRERAENTENRASAAVYKYAGENVADNRLKYNPAAYKAGILPSGISSGLHVTDSESIEDSINAAFSEIVFNTLDEEVRRDNSGQNLGKLADMDYNRENAGMEFLNVLTDFSGNNGTADKSSAAVVAKAHFQSGKTAPLANQDVFRGSAETPANVAASYRDKLDEKTITALDKIISRASFAVKPASLQPAQSVLTYASALSDNQAEGQSIGLNNPGEKIGIIGRRMGILSGSEGFSILTQSRISSSAKKSLSEKNINIGEMIFSGSGYSFTNTKEGGAAVLALPEQLTESTARGAYERSPAPMEYKLREESGKFSENSRPLKTINSFPIKRETVKTTVSSRFEDLTREEIKKITDAVYKQLQTRLKNERRRMGM